MHVSFTSRVKEKKTKFFTQTMHFSEKYLRTIRVFLSTYGIFLSHMPLFLVSPTPGGTFGIDSCICTYVLYAVVFLMTWQISINGGTFCCYMLCLSPPIYVSILLFFQHEQDGGLKKVLMFLFLLMLLVLHSCVWHSFTNDFLSVLSTLVWHFSNVLYVTWGGWVHTIFLA